MEWPALQQVGSHRLPRVTGRRHAFANDKEHGRDIAAMTVGDDELISLRMRSVFGR